MTGPVYFQPEDGGAAIPLQRRTIEEVLLPDTGIDPSLLLFGFGILGFLGFIAFLAYLAHKK